MNITVLVIHRNKKTEVIKMTNCPISRLYDLLKYLKIDKKEVSVVIDGRLAIKNEKIKDHDIIKIINI